MALLNPTIYETRQRAPFSPRHRSFGDYTFVLSADPARAGAKVEILFWILVCDYDINVPCWVVWESAKSQFVEPNVPVLAVSLQKNTLSYGTSWLQGSWG